LLAEIGVMVDPLHPSSYFSAALAFCDLSLVLVSCVKFLQGCVGNCLEISEGIYFDWIIE